MTQDSLKDKLKGKRGCRASALRSLLAPTPATTAKNCLEYRFSEVGRIEMQ